MTALSHSPVPFPAARLLAPAVLAAILAAGLARCGADAPARTPVPAHQTPLHAPAPGAMPALEGMPA